MMVEDYLNSANINAASVRNKRAVTPSKSTPQRKKQVSSDRSTLSTPSSPSRPVNLEFPDSIADVHSIHEDNPPPQNVIALISNARDPRLRRKENEISSAGQSRTPSDTISYLSRTLKNRILMRVLKLWQFKWLKVRITTTWNTFYGTHYFIFLFSNKYTTKNLLHCLARIQNFHWKFHSCSAFQY